MDSVAAVQADGGVNGPITAPMMSEMLAANQPVMVDDTNIINVWRDNLEEAFKDIAEIVQTVSHPPPINPSLVLSHTTLSRFVVFPGCAYAHFFLHFTF